MNPARVRRWAMPLALGCSVTAHPALAQIKTDGTLGARTDLRGLDIQINEDLGKRIGDNLFYSFEQFNVRTLPDGTIESARFTGPGDLANVISQVTGGDPSEINGLLRSQIGKADFWFINPTGVAFGSNARLDVPGSFHVSTADQLQFGGGAVFSRDLRLNVVGLFGLAAGSHTPTARRRSSSSSRPGLAEPADVQVGHQCSPCGSRRPGSTPRAELERAHPRPPAAAQWGEVALLADLSMRCPSVLRGGSSTFTGTAVVVGLRRARVRAWAPQRSPTSRQQRHL